MWRISGLLFTIEIWELFRFGFRICRNVVCLAYMELNEALRRISGDISVYAQI